MKADEEHYHLCGITLEDLDITAFDTDCDEQAVENLVIRNVTLTKKDTIDYPDSITTLDVDNNIQHKAGQ